MTKTEMLNRLYQVKVSIRATLVLNYLINRANADLTCFPAIKTIAKDCNMSARTVQRALNDLLEAGLIEKDSRFRDNGGQSSNLYSLCLDSGHGLSSQNDNIKNRVEFNNEKNEKHYNQENVSIPEIGFVDLTKIDNNKCFSLQSNPNQTKGNKNEKIGKLLRIETRFRFLENKACQGEGDRLWPP